MTDQHRDSTPPAEGPSCPTTCWPRGTASRGVGRARGGRSAAAAPGGASSRRSSRSRRCSSRSAPPTASCRVRSPHRRPRPTALPATRGSSASSASLALAQISQTLAADQRAINALAVSQAKLARGAGGDGGGSSAGASIQLPALPSIGSLPADLGARGHLGARGERHDGSLRCCPLTTLAESDVDAELVVSARAMATRVTLKVPLVGRDAAFAARAELACAQATDLFKEVDRTCTRFDARSALMRANTSPTRWHEVPEPLFLAIREAKRAYDETAGRFDPRVLRWLVALGYDKTLPFGTEDVRVDATADARFAAPDPWRPRLRDATREVVIGPEPIDLGGVGKGLAVRWASRALAAVTPDFLVEAGGDVYAAGSGSGRGGLEHRRRGPRIAERAARDPVGARPRRHDVVDPAPQVDRRRHARPPPDRPEHRPPGRSGPRVGDRRRQGPGACRGLEQGPVRQRPLRHRRAREAPFDSRAVDRRVRRVRHDEDDGAVRPMAAAMTPALADKVATGAHGALVAALAVLVPLGAGAALALAVSPSIPSKLFPWVTARALGIAAYVALTALVALGTWMRHPWRLRLRLGHAESLLRAHAALGMATIALVVAHLAFLATDRYAGVGWVGALIPGASSYRRAGCRARRRRARADGGDRRHRSTRRPARGAPLAPDPPARPRDIRPRVVPWRPLGHRRRGPPTDVRHHRNARGGPGSVTALGQSPVGARAWRWRADGSARRSARGGRHRIWRDTMSSVTPVTMRRDTRESSATALAGSCGVLGDPGTRLLAGPRRSEGMESLASHRARLGPLELGHPDALLQMIADSGLLGRGGGQFPTARKLELAASSRGRALVVVNASEGEPASEKDQTMLCHRPHLVLDGAMAAAWAIGATEVVVYLHRARRTSTSALELAVAERDDDGATVRLVDAPMGYVAGESSAVVSYLDGTGAIPRKRALPAAAFGVAGRPTVVNNVETIAHLGLIARFGPAWFAEAGDRRSPGSTLVTVAGEVPAPGTVAEVVGTRSIGEVLGVHRTARSAPKAVLIGGYEGTWLDGETAWETPLTRGPLAACGASLGCGVLAVLAAGSCGLRTTARLARWLADESAGQCGPCVFGLPAVADALDDLARGCGDRRDVRRLRILTASVHGRGACGHPTGVASLVDSALDAFAADVDRHARGKGCEGAAAPFPLQSRLPEWS